MHYSKTWLDLVNNERITNLLIEMNNGLMQLRWLWCSEMQLDESKPAFQGF